MGRNRQKGNDYAGHAVDSAGLKSVASGSVYPS